MGWALVNWGQQRMEDSTTLFEVRYFPYVCGTKPVPSER